jgi:hypothetical protein
LAYAGSPVSERAGLLTGLYHSLYLDSTTDADTIHKWMKEAIVALRSYFKMRISSLNETLTDGETPLEVLVPSREDNPIDRLAYLELQTEINTLLQAEIAQIEPSLLSI